MHCPHCHSDSAEALFTCPTCGQTTDRAALETLHHLVYLEKWLERERPAIVNEQTYASLYASAQQQLHLAHAALKPSAPAAPSRSAEAVTRDLNLVQGVRARLTAWTEADVISAPSAQNLRQHLSDRLTALEAELLPQPAAATNQRDLSAVEVLDFASESLPAWTQQGYLLPDEAHRLQAHMSQRRANIVPAGQAHVPAPAPTTPQPQVKPSAPVVQPPTPPKPVTPPPPPRPPINWARVWERAWGLVVSGALLRGLLYLGAFMIVASAIVLVVVYWLVFPLFVQIGFVAAIPLSFYAGGFALRTRLKIPQAGTVFTGIGALLVAVDFIAVYRLANLSASVNVHVYWLAASLICTLMYVFTVWRLPTEFFAYLALIGVNSSVLALANVLRLPLEWQNALMAGVNAATIGVAVRLKNTSGEWTALARATRYLPHIVLPVSAALTFYMPRADAWGHAGTFAFAALASVVLAWRFPAAFYGHAAAWSALGVFGFTCLALKMPLEWYAATGAVLSFAYLLASAGLARRMPKDFKLGVAYRRALHVLVFGLIAVGAFGGLATLFVEYWPGVAALALASLALAACTYILRMPLLAGVAAGLFIAPVSLVVLRLTPASDPRWLDWLMTGWAGLALAYLALAALLRRAERYGAPLILWAQGLAPASALVVIWSYSFFPPAWYNGPTLAALSGALGAYLLSAVLQGRGLPAMTLLTGFVPRLVRRALFLWPSAALAPIILSVAWQGTVLPLSWLGVALSALGLLYVGGGQVLVRRAMEYRLPFHVGAYVVAVVGIGVAASQEWPLMAALGLGVVICAALAIFHRYPIQTLIAALLSVWPLQLALALSPLAPHAHSLVNALLASLLYIPFGLWLGRRARLHALAVYVVGYALAAYAVAMSLLGRFEVYPQNIVWIGALVPLIVTGLTVFSVYRFTQRPFAWAAVLLSFLSYGQTLTLLRIPPEYDALAWMLLSLACLLGERALAWRAAKTRIALFRWPLGLGGAALSMLGLALTAIPTVSVFTRGWFSGHAGVHVPHILAAQMTAVLISGLAARLYRSRWPLYLTLALAFVPVTVFFSEYAQLLLGRALTTPQFSFVWLGLAALGLIGAALVDRGTVRYAHGLYLSSYALASLAGVWSLTDRGTNLYVLGLWIAGALASQALVSFGQHRSFDDLLRLFWPRPEPRTGLRRGAQALFLFAAVYALPFWLFQLFTQWEIALGWRGLALTLTALVYLALGWSARRIRAEYAWPFYSAAQALTLIGALLAARDPLFLCYVLMVDTVVYAGCAYLFRRAFWLYPCLFAAHLALVAYAASIPSGQPLAYLALPFHALTWLMALIGSAVRFRERRAAAASDERLPLLRQLLTRSWAQPFFLFAALDLALWQLVALPAYMPALVVALGSALLLAVLATVWMDTAAPYGALAFGVVAVGVHFVHLRLALADSLAWSSGLGFGLYLLGWLAALPQRARLTLWVAPLTNVAIGSVVVCVLFTTPLVSFASVPVALTWTIAGAFGLTMAYRRRSLRLGYAGLGALEAAWVVLLLGNNIVELQWYALPTGLYLILIGTLERRIARQAGQTRKWAVLIESFGLAVLLLTTFIQSLRGGAAGLPYFILMIVEGIAVIAWGGLRRIKAPFFIGLAASVLNVLGQVVVLFAGGATLTRWLIIGGAGLLIIAAAVIVERQRVLILAKAGEWRAALEKWD